MKKLFKTFIAVAIIGSVASISSCTKTCDTGYEGDKCDVEVRTKFVGSYLASGTINPGAITFQNEPLVITPSGTNISNINIAFVGVLLSATTNGTSFTLNSSTSNGYTYTGSGSITGTNITMTLNEDGNGENNIFTINAIKQ